MYYTLAEGIFNLGRRLQHTLGDTLPIKTICICISSNREAEPAQSFNILELILYKYVHTYVYA